MKKVIFLVLVAFLWSFVPVYAQISHTNCSNNGTDASAIGNNSQGNGTYSFAAGYYTQANANNAFVFGSGTSRNPLNNGTPNSFLIGFDNKPVFSAQLTLVQFDESFHPRVGICTTTPRTTLDVNGATRTSSLRIVNKTIEYTQQKLGFYSIIEGDGGFESYPLIPTLFLNDDKVGIMTNNPAATLDVDGSVKSKTVTADTVKINRSIFLPNEELSFTYYYSSGDSSDPGEEGEEDIGFDKSMGGDSLRSGLGSSGVKTMMTLKRVSSSTHLGIGTTSPTANLHVVGDGFVTGQLSVGTSSATANNIFKIKFRLGDLWTFSDLSSAKVMGYNCHFWEAQSQQVRIVSGASSAVKLNTNGSLQLCTAPSGAQGSSLNWNYLTMLNNGNVGIGVTNPQYPLDVNGDANFDNAHTNNIYFPGTEMKIRKIILESPRDTTREANIKDIMTFKESGNVGIGTTDPQKRLHVQGDTYLDGKLGIGTTSPTKKLHVAGDSYISGNLGIGTTDPGEFKLRVHGKINCTEVVVTANAKGGGGDEEEWPDYVFAEDYSLRSLDEVASYIQQNGRLPEIPSAAEVSEKGVNLLEINTLLLKKVEEMTLYIIDLQNQINELKK